MSLCLYKIKYSFQFQFVNSFLALFYIAFYLQDMDKLKDVSARFCTVWLIRSVTGLGWLLFWLFHCLSDSAWADESLAEGAE